MDNLHEPPEEAGLDVHAWTVPLAQHYPDQEFDVQYCDRHVRRLMTAAGLSRQTARPQYVDADERAQEAFREGLKRFADLDDEYTVVAINQTRQELANLVYAWFPEGERPTLPVSSRWKSLKLLGGITNNEEAFYLPCEDNSTSDLTVRLLDALQTKFGEKRCVVLDNAPYFTANKVNEFADGTPFKLCYLPRGSPELNPAEKCWHQLSQRLGNQLFEELDEFRDVALAVLASIESPNLSSYLCP